MKRNILTFWMIN